MKDLLSGLIVLLSVLIVLALIAAVVIGTFACGDGSAGIGDCVRAIING